MFVYFTDFDKTGDNLDEDGKKRAGSRKPEVVMRVFVYQEGCAGYAGCAGLQVVNPTNHKDETHKSSVTNHRSLSTWKFRENLRAHLRKSARNRGER